MTEFVKLPTGIRNIVVDGEDWTIIPEKGMPENRESRVGRLIFSNGRDTYATPYEAYDSTYVPAPPIAFHQWGDVCYVPMKVDGFVIVAYWYLVEWPIPTEPKVTKLSEIRINVRGFAIQVYRKHHPLY